MTQLMVIEGHQLQVHGADEPELEQEVQAEENEFDRDALIDINDEIEYLETAVECDSDRMKDFIRKVDMEVADENREIIILARSIAELQMELQNSDDLEDQEAAREALDQMDDFDIEPEDDDAPSRNSEVEEDDVEQEAHDSFTEREQRMEQRRLLKHIFKLITIKTHPDKCGHTSKLNYYHEACKFRDRNNLHGLQGVYKKVYGHDYGATSLYDKLKAARDRREQLRQQLSDIRSTGAWQLYQVSVEYDFPRAISVLRTNLHMQIQGMRAMLSQLQKRNWM